MNALKDQEAQKDDLFKQAIDYASVYTDYDQGLIAAKAYTSGYVDATNEKLIDIKELAGIVKMLLPGISMVSPENLKKIESFIEKSDNL